MPPPPPPPLLSLLENKIRVGLRFLLPSAFSSIRWFGRGPHENYPDRKASAPIGTHASTVADQLTPYIRPGECGAKSDVRWLELIRPRQPSEPSRPSEAAVVFTVPRNEAGVGGEGAKSSSNDDTDTFAFSALPCLAEDLSGVAHAEQLSPPRPEAPLTAVSLDHLLMGVGGDDSWSSSVHEEFLVRPGRFRFAFSVAPFWREVCDDGDDGVGNSADRQAIERWRSLRKDDE